MLGLTPSGVVDSGVTSSCGRLSDPFIKTGKLSHKQFQVATGQVALTPEQAKLLHNGRAPRKSVDIVPAMIKDTLISFGKFADVRYFTIFDDEEVNIYDGLKANLKIREEAIIKGWRDRAMGYTNTKQSREIEHRYSAVRQEQE